jgi:hypothetical protein
MEKRNCEHCRELFAPRQINQRFCMEECRHSFHAEEKSKALALLRELQAHPQAAE